MCFDLKERFHCTVRAEEEEEEEGGGGGGSVEEWFVWTFSVLQTYFRCK